MAVYLIRESYADFVKIGKADDPIHRLQQLQVRQPVRLRLLRVWEGGYAEEDALHARFKDFRLDGERFVLVPAMLEDVGLPERWRAGMPIARAAPRRSDAGRFFDAYDAKEGVRGLIYDPMVEVAATIKSRLRRDIAKLNIRKSDEGQLAGILKDLESLIAICREAADPTNASVNTCPVSHHASASDAPLPSAQAKSAS